MKTNICLISRLLPIMMIVLLITGALTAQTTEFTYQGSLNNGGTPATGNYDFEFALYDALSGGSQVGSTLPRAPVAVANGTFAVKLDFGNQFPGANRFLEMRVRQTGGGAFTPLAPRQLINSTPYSVRSSFALTANSAFEALNSSQLAGMPASQFVQITDPRLSDARNPLPNSGNYIQNQNAAAQPTSNFNIAGTGTANIFNAGVQFNIGGNRILSHTGGSNLFAGFGAGLANSVGDSNSFFGFRAGDSNTDGDFNSFFGMRAGDSNTTGNNNTIIGFDADVASGGLSFATALGAGATVGASNTLVLGRGADAVQIPGAMSVTGAFTANGSALTNLNAGNITAGTLDPARLANGVILNTTTQQPTSNFNVSGTGTANIVNAATQFNIGGNRILSNAGTRNLFAGVESGQTNTGADNAFFGDDAGRLHTTGGANSFFGRAAGGGNTEGGGNSFFGFAAGSGNTIGDENTMIGVLADVGANNLTRATAIGSRALVTQSNSLVLGSNEVPGTNVGIGTTAPAQRLHVVGNGLFTGNMTVSGTLSVGSQLTVNDNGTFNGDVRAVDGLFSGNVTGNIGSFDGVLHADGNVTTSANLGIGTTSPVARLHVITSTTNAADNTATFRAPNIGLNSSHIHFGTTGDWYIRSAASNGKVILQDLGGNVGIGTTAPSSRLHIADNSGQMLYGGGGCGAGFTGIGFASTLNCTNYSILGNGTDTMVNAPGTGNILFRIGNLTKAGIDTSGNLGVGTTAPTERLHVVGNGLFTGNLTTNGKVEIGTLGSSGVTTLCRNPANEIGVCSSSARYKSNINPFSSGLDIVRKLRPVSFTWKDGGMPDMGLVAEEVAEVEPLLATTNDKGEIEGVKYDRIGVVLVNAVKEQQAQIEALRKELDERKAREKSQQSEINALKRIICSIKPGEKICQP